MTRTKSAFTIIEVSLFIAISGFLIAGIIAGTSASIFRQRYQDSVNSFTEFLRDIYSKVINVENIRESAENFKCTVTSSTELGGANPGRSDCVLYGKLVTFGEDDNSTIVHVYDVIGGDTIRKNANDFTADVKSKNINSVINALANVDADVVAPKLTDTSIVNFAAGHFTYMPEWGATLENPDDDGTVFKGSLLIVRSPLSGSVHTFILHNQVIAASTEVGEAITTGSSNYLSTILKNSPSSFNNTSAINICIGSDDIATFGNRRRNVRILADGNTASSVELIPLDSGENVCLK